MVGAVAPPIQLPATWRRLAVAAGGVAALSRLMGVHEKTIRRWARGETPMSRLAIMAVKTVSDELGVPSPSEAPMREERTAR
jgi:hypothetical protein